MNIAAGSFPIEKEYKLNCRIAIIGGGSAGACCALALSNLGVTDITLIESSDYDQFRIGESIPPEIKPLFIELGIWQQFLALKQQPCYGSRSWWGDELRGHNDSLLNPRGHGWHLDRLVFNHFLAEQAEKRGIRLLTNCQFKKVDLNTTKKKGHQLNLIYNSKTASLSAEFVIDASGAKGFFAKAMGSEKMFSDPLICSARRFKIKTNDQTESDVHPLTGLTHLESVDSGWWYAARIPGQQILISHTTDNQTFRNMKLKKVKNWEQALNSAPNTHLLLEKARAIDIQPRIYHAASFVLDKIVSDNWLAAGDSASSFDPITSQGILKSVSDGVTAAQCVAQSLDKHDKTFLQDYQAKVHLRHQQYRQMRNHFYSLEGRFAGSQFWAKMQRSTDFTIDSTV